MEMPLGFNQNWVTLGIVSMEEIQQLVELFESSDDKNEEHYRWRAFKTFLVNKKPFSPETIRELYHLADNDPDFMMGGSLMIDIIELPECPADILDLASSNTNRKNLVKFATMYKKWRASSS